MILTALKSHKHLRFRQSRVDGADDLMVVHFDSFKHVRWSAHESFVLSTQELTTWSAPLKPQNLTLATWTSNPKKVRVFRVKNYSGGYVSNLFAETVSRLGFPHATSRHWITCGFGDRGTWVHLTRIAYKLSRGETPQPKKCSVDKMHQICPRRLRLN